MLYTYTYVPHQMERMQRFVNYIFYQVWCRAHKLGPYSLNLFDDNPPLKEVMTDFAYGDSTVGDRFTSRIEAIYGEFARLPRVSRKTFKRWYHFTNDIEKICNNEIREEWIGKYKSIERSHPALAKSLSQFFKDLWLPNLLSLKAIKGKIGEIEDHYDHFMAINKIHKCPFCGISDMLGFYTSKREAYDHYLSKAIYAFNSINFHNLSPACHHCNSTYKSTKDPAFIGKDPTRGGARRKAFYPYTKNSYSIEITIDLPVAILSKLSPKDILLSFESGGYSEEVETWLDVYGIDERFKDKLLSGDGESWLTEVLDEWRWKSTGHGEGGQVPAEYLSMIKRQAKRSPFTDSKFLKNAFLEGCDRAGYFSIGYDLLIKTPEV